MNYLQLIIQFWKHRRKKRITSLQADLYMFLIQECNEQDWENPFECSNGRICTSIGITEKSVIDARNRLKQLGLIDFENGLTRQKSPTYYLLEYWNKVSNPGGKVVSNPVSNPGGNQVYTKNKPNQTETKPNGSKSHSGAAPPAPKKKTELLFWKKFIAVWNDWYKIRLGNEYLYLEKDFSHFKKIYKFLEKRAGDKQMEFTEENLVGAFRYFLDKAWEKDEWLRQNFSVSNVLSQFNSIVNGTKSNHQNGKQPTGASVSTGSILSKIAAMPDQVRNS